MFDLYPKERGDVLLQRDVKVAGVLSDELLPQLLACGCMDNVGHIQPMEDPVFSCTFHEDGLFTVVPN